MGRKSVIRPLSWPQMGGPNGFETLPDGKPEKKVTEGLFNQWWNLQEGGDAMGWEDRITVDPKVLVGKPVIKGTRIAIEFLIELLANGWTHEQILVNYPHLAEEDITAALHYAAEALKQEHVYPLPV